MAYGFALRGKPIDLRQKSFNFLKITKPITFSSYREIETIIDFDSEIIGVVYDPPTADSIPVHSDPWTSYCILTHEIINNKIKFKSKYERGLAQNWQGNVNIIILYYSKIENYNYGLKVNNSRVSQPIILSELKIKTIDPKNRNEHSLKSNNPILILDTGGKYVRLSNPYEITVNETTTIKYKEILKQQKADGYGVNVFKNNENILSINSDRFKSNNILNSFKSRFKQNKYYKGDNEFWFVGRLPHYKESDDTQDSMYFGEDDVMCKITNNELEIRVWSNYRYEYGGANYNGWSKQDVEFSNLIYISKLIPI